MKVKGMKMSLAAVMASTAVMTAAVTPVHAAQTVIHVKSIELTNVSTTQVVGKAPRFTGTFKVTTDADDKVTVKATQEYYEADQVVSGIIKISEATSDGQPDLWYADGDDLGDNTVLTTWTSQEETDKNIALYYGYNVMIQISAPNPEQYTLEIASDFKDSYNGIPFADGSLITAAEKTANAYFVNNYVDSSRPIEADEMYRMYNPNSGEHFYTANAGERDTLTGIGWNYEGVGWTAPKTSNTPVFRMYNPVAGEHHYTTGTEERDMLVNNGWSFEGIGWYSDDGQNVPVFRQYNPNAYACNHNYTPSKEENDILVNAGWQYEGISWYAVQ